MGFGRRLARKAVRKTVPRSVRHTMHPVRTLKYAATPRAIHQASRVIYTITNPLGAAENKLINASYKGGRSNATRRQATSFNGGEVQNVTGSGIRAEEGAESHEWLAQLMMVGHEKFTEARRPIIPDPHPVDPKPWWEAEWNRRKSEVKFWQRSATKKLKSDINWYAQARAAEVLSEMEAQQRKKQVEADSWWTAMVQGDPIVVGAALKNAFADNAAPVVVSKLNRADAVLIIDKLPGPDVLPEKKLHITPTGRLSSKAWAKTELNDAYAELLAAHLLATIREAWAVAPSLTKLRVIGLFNFDAESNGVLFDVDVVRTQGDWANDTWGEVILESSQWGLNRVNKARTVFSWPKDQMRPWDFI